MIYPKFYLFESKYTKRKHFTSGFKKLLDELNIVAELGMSCTRYEYDCSYNTSWWLYYGDNRNQLNIDREKLLSIKYMEQQVFSVGGNGYGTGLSIKL